MQLLFGRPGTIHSIYIPWHKVDENPTTHVAGKKEQEKQVSVTQLDRKRHISHKADISWISDPMI